MENLAEVWKLLGRQPRLSDMTSRISKFSRHAYINCFGSWYNTLTEFEKWYKRCLPLTKGEYPPGGGGLYCDTTDRINLGIDLPDQGSGATNNNVIKGETNNQANPSPRYPGLRLRMEVLKRDRYKCKMCGRSPAQFPHLWLEVDHDIPWANGGSTTPGNLQTLCNECNRGKGDLNNE